MIPKVKKLTAKEYESARQRKAIQKRQDMQIMLGEAFYQGDLDIVKGYKRTDKEKEKFIKACISLQKMGYTQEELKKLSGFSRATIAKWMREEGFTPDKWDTLKARKEYTRIKKYERQRV